MVYLSHYSLQRRFNLEGVISTFLCLPLYPVSPCLRMIRLVPARRSCPVFLISGHKDLVPRTKRSFVSFFCPYLAAVRISNTQSFRGAASWGFRCGVPGKIFSSISFTSRTSFRPSSRRIENVSILLLLCLDKCSLLSVILIRMFLRLIFFMIVVYNTTLRHENVN